MNLSRSLLFSRPSLRSEHDIDRYVFFSFVSLKISISACLSLVFVGPGRTKAGAKLNHASYITAPLSLKRKRGIRYTRSMHTQCPLCRWALSRRRNFGMKAKALAFFWPRSSVSEVSSVVLSLSPWAPRKVGAMTKIHAQAFAIRTATVLGPSATALTHTAASVRAQACRSSATSSSYSLVSWSFLSFFLARSLFSVVEPIASLSLGVILLIASLCFGGCACAAFRASWA